MNPNSVFAALLEFAFANYLSRQSHGILISRRVKCKQLEIMVNKYFQKRWSSVNGHGVRKPMQEKHSKESRKETMVHSFSYHGTKNVTYKTNGINHVVRKRIYNNIEVKLIHLMHSVSKYCGC